MCLMKTREGKSHDYRDYIVFKMFSVRTETKTAVFRFLRLEEHFRAWTEGLTVEIKLRFQISPAERGGAQPRSQLPWERVWTGPYWIYGLSFCDIL